MKKRKGALLLSVMLLFLGIFSAAGASAHTAAAGTSQNTERTTAHSRVSEQESENTDMAVHFLDVGQGLSILVQSGGQNLLYDGGDRSASSFVVSYLKKQNVETIDYLIASHYDSDHISGLVGCLNASPIWNWNAMCSVWAIMDLPLPLPGTSSGKPFRNTL